MAYVKIVPAADMEVLEKYLSCRDLVLVPESRLHSFPTKVASKVRDMDDTYVSYSFGGEADHSVDILQEFPSFQATELGLGGIDE